MNLNKLLLEIPQSPTILQADLVRKLKAQGHDIISLQTGDPDFPTPEPIIRAAYDAMQKGMTHYCESKGLPELREAISQKLKIENKCFFDPTEEILVTNGGIHAVFCALQSIIDSGSEALIPDPSWPTYGNMVRMLGGNPILVPSNPLNGFWPTVEEFKKYLSPRTVCIIINSPNNPTGTIASIEYLKKLGEFAVSNNLFIISDEVYEYITFDGREHHSMASLQDLKDHVLTVNSFSKSFSMTGWRIGYLAASKKVIQLALKASQFSITNVPTFTQKAALEAITCPEVKNYVCRMLDKYRSRRNLMLKIFEENKDSLLTIFPPQGAFYFFIDFKRLNILSSKLSERLIQEAGVSLVPGVAFGNRGEGYLRMTFAASEENLKEAARRIFYWLKKNSCLK